MKKIPTLFVRDEQDRRYVTAEVSPGCEWVLEGEGVPTRKYDGTCVMYDGERWWARREVKPGKTSPPFWRHVDSDTTTGKSVGWEPVEQSAFAKYLAEAVTHDRQHHVQHEAGTYELIGPKVNGNPEQALMHSLVRHGEYDLGGIPLHFDGLREWLQQHDYEGIVWHHKDGRMVKIKRRDFPVDPS